MEQFTYLYLKSVISSFILLFYYIHPVLQVGTLVTPACYPQYRPVAGGDHLAQGHLQQGGGAHGGDQRGSALRVWLVPSPHPAVVQAPHLPGPHLPAPVDPSAQDLPAEIRYQRKVRV